MTRRPDIDAVYQGYDLENLHEAFDAVANEKDWCAPIYSRCRLERAEIVRAAIEFFVGETPTIDWMDWRDDDYDPDCYRVESVGYRAGPAGP